MRYFEKSSFQFQRVSFVVDNDVIVVVVDVDDDVPVVVAVVVVSISIQLLLLFLLQFDALMKFTFPENRRNIKLV